MTVTPITETTEETTANLSWGEITVRLANNIAAEGFKRGDLAALRRMNPEEPDVAAFWRLTARYDLYGKLEVERKWALVLHGIALMTRTSGDATSDRSAHIQGMSVGRALFIGGDPARTSAYYSETRFNRLLTARGPMMRTLLARMFRMMAAANQGFNWYQMAQLILNDGYDEERADRIRRSIARDYYRAEYQNTPSN